ncbi:hypothetical protein M0638_27580 [Roseomonas sp. NAR14]|uniref:Uncharacterized protein n=1 Tax=Roseomonas acroporae TaxID=2937791 RepID=A0A9X1YDF9_9PROT|nr:hypothetical protein [Roseomonas acroporae]MCK8788121.1 hypothetical protein [Roseomonas acroporae]
MSDETIWHRASLTASEWYVQCPVCGGCSMGVDTEEDDGGAIIPRADEQFQQCPDCDAFIEVRAVSVTEAYPDDNTH